jgi:DNA mismatch repair protein MutL
MITIKELQIELKKMGFDFDIEDTQSIRKINVFSQPSGINIGAVEVAFLDIIDDYIANEKLKQIPKQDRIIASVACKSAIKAGQKLSEEEMKNIVSNLLNCNMQYVCPHGRPIIVYFPINE